MKKISLLKEYRAGFKSGQEAHIPQKTMGKTFFESKELLFSPPAVVIYWLGHYHGANGQSFSEFDNKFQLTN